MKHSTFLGYNQELCFAESPVSCKSHASPWDQHTNHQHNTETYADILSKNIINTRLDLDQFRQQPRTSGTGLKCIIFFSFTHPERTAKY